MVITKYINEVNTLLHEEGTEQDRLTTIQGWLSEELNYIKCLDCKIWRSVKSRISTRK